MKIFIYGTLLRGEERAHVLTEGGGEFISKAETPPEFTMLSMFGGAYPGLVHEGSTVVKGELWEVPLSLIHYTLDPIEGHPTYYHRTPIKVADYKGELLDAEAYLLPSMWLRTDAAAQIESGDWKAWHSQQNN